MERVYGDVDMDISVPFSEVPKVVYGMIGLAMMISSMAYMLYLLFL